MIYWASIKNPAVKMASLNGTGQFTLLNESKASYTGITLYRDSLYISDTAMRYASSTGSATTIVCTLRNFLLILMLGLSLNSMEAVFLVAFS